MDGQMHEKPHFTTRRGFITATGFGVVGLYGLWAAYGAAPLGVFRKPEEHADAGENADAGGHGAAAGPSPAEFRKLAENFIEANKQPDGSVWPRLAATGGDHAHHGTTEYAVAAALATQPIDVYLIAYQWGFAPSLLRLDVNAHYRFRMMAVDVTHGAAIRVGAASRITRLRAGALVEQQFRFTKSGRHLVYCTSYCGILHDRMRGSIIVA
jgi:heme/copper-type cytochrome/quinol oxidase subunit 2